MSPKPKTKKGEVCPDAAKVRRLRYEKRFTQEALANRAGVGKKTVEHIENGKSVRPTTLGQIADALEVPVSEILLPSTTSNAEDRLSRLEKRLEAFENYVFAEGLRLTAGFDAAIFLYTSVIESAGDDQLAQNALVGVAKVYRQQGKWKLAIKALDQVFSMPNTGVTHFRAHYNKACYLHLSGHDNESVFRELRAASECATTPNFYFERAISDPDFVSLRHNETFRALVSPKT